MHSINTRASNARAGWLKWLLTCLVGSGMISGAALGDPAASGPNANTVIGANPLLSDGADALMNGDWKRGIQLTELGINETLSRDDHAAALANLCAGYAALQKFAKALELCNRSLAMVDNNWRAWQNRAACYLGLGKIEEALRDVQHGLQLNPDSDALQKTLAIAREYEKLQQERMQHLLES